MSGIGGMPDRKHLILGQFTMQFYLIGVSINMLQNLINLILGACICANLDNLRSSALRDHLMEERDYFLLPETAWNKLTSWYGLEEQSTVIARKAVEHGMYIKHCKFEVYLLEFKLAIHPNIDYFKWCSFSKLDTVENLEAALRKEFEVEEDAECRVWRRFMTHTYELLSNRSQTLQDAGLYNGQVKLLDYYHLFICFI
jgi:hypothetical protein